MTESADDAVIGRIRLATGSTRAFLCALARRGKALARTEPARAERLLGAVSAHPLYKAGRFGFDLLELEDLMLDGPPPAQVDGYFEADAVSAVIDSMRRLERALVQAAAASRSVAVVPSAERPPVLAVAAAHGLTLATEDTPPEGWPPITSADYLYDLVVLGVLRQFSRVAAAEAAATSATGHA